MLSKRNNKGDRVIKHNNNKKIKNKNNNQKQKQNQVLQQKLADCVHQEENKGVDFVQREERGDWLCSGGRRRRRLLTNIRFTAAFAGQFDHDLVGSVQQRRATRLSVPCRAPCHLLNGAE